MLQVETYIYVAARRFMPVKVLLYGKSNINLSDIAGDLLYQAPPPCYQYQPLSQNLHKISMLLHVKYIILFLKQLQ